MITVKLEYSKNKGTSEAFLEKFCTEFNYLRNSDGAITFDYNNKLQNDMALCKLVLKLQLISEFDDCLFSINVGNSKTDFINERGIEIKYYSVPQFLIMRDDKKYFFSSNKQDLIKDIKAEKYFNKGFTYTITNLCTDQSIILK